MLDLNQIHLGDAKELATTIPDNSVDLIFTDPVYENPDDYLWLAQFAERVLKPGKSCLAWTSVPKAATNQKMMEESLRYVYTLSYRIPNKRHKLIGYRLNLSYTPCLWFCKGALETPQEWLDDVIESTSKPNGTYKWNKNPEAIFSWLTALSRVGDLVVDPFTGSGVVPWVCIQTGRDYWACEIKPKVYERARGQLAQMPMFQQMRLVE